VLSNFAPLSNPLHGHSVLSNAEFTPLSNPTHSSHSVLSADSLATANTNCPAYTGQAISGNAQVQIFEANSGLWLSQVTAQFSNNPQTLAFASTTPVSLTISSAQAFQNGFMGILNYNGNNWDINGRYGGIFTQSSSPYFYVNIIPNGSGGVTLKAVQTNYNSNQYNLNLFNINGQETLSYGNINGAGNFQVFMCPVPWTGQPLPNPSSTHFAIYESNSGTYLTQVTAQFSNNPQTLAFASTTPQLFTINNPSSFQNGFMGILNFNNNNWDINGGYGGIFTQSSSPAFYVNIIPNGSGGVTLKAVQTNYNSNQYNLNLFNINGQRTLSYGNINGAGNFIVYIYS